MTDFIYLTLALYIGKASKKIVRSFEDEQKSFDWRHVQDVHYLVVVHFPAKSPKKTERAFHELRP